METQNALNSHHEHLNSNGTRETPHLVNVSFEQIMGLPPPLGLRLRKTASAVKEINDILKARERDKQNASMAKKFTAVSFSATLLKIGEYTFEPLNEADLVAKCYFARRRLVWEVLDRSTNIKKKVEVPWENILAIRAVTDENRPGILEIELKSQPAFYHEIKINPRPRSHTTWEATEDFTGSHASRYRRHYLEFPPGVLGKQYQKLLQSDDRLLHLSQRPFPSLESPYFDSALLNEGAKDNDHVNVHDLNGWETNPTSHQQQPEPVIPPHQAQQYGNTCTQASSLSSLSLMHSIPPPTPPGVEIHVNGFNNNPLPQDPGQDQLGHDHGANMVVMLGLGEVNRALLQPYLSHHDILIDNGNFSDVTSTMLTDSFETQMANVEQVSWEQLDNGNGNFGDITLQTDFDPGTQHVANGELASLGNMDNENYFDIFMERATPLSSHSGVSMEANPAYYMNGNMSTQTEYHLPNNAAMVNSMEAHSTNYGLEGHYSATASSSNGNMNGYGMHNGVLYDPHDCYIPPVQATNFILENHLPHNQHNPSNGNMNGYYGMHNGFLCDPPYFYTPPVQATNGTLENHLPHRIPHNPSYSNGAHGN